MNQTVICTIGTSLARECPSLAGFQRRASSWDEDTIALTREIEARIGRHDLREPSSLTELSAELNSLQRLGLGAGDHVVLLATDTAEGRACGEMLARCVTNVFHLPETDVRVVRIEGLQVRDAERLRKVGLVKLLDTILTYVMDPQIRFGSEIVLNATGGYKGVVPFLTVVGMLFRLRTVYIFEFAETLICLPPLPFSFDLHLYQRALPALNEIVRESFVPEEQFFRKITNFQEHERDLFGGFVETVEPGIVTLSPLAFALQKVEQGGPRTIYLAPAVAEDYQKATEFDRLQFDRALGNLANPLWRTMHYHSFPSTDLTVYKWYASTLRVATIPRGDRVYVCEVYTNHDRYERDLPGRKAADYTLDSFIPWEPSTPEDVETPFLQALEQENGELKSRIGKLEAQLSQTSAEIRGKVGKRIKEQVRHQYEKQIVAMNRTKLELSRCHEEVKRLKQLVGERTRPDSKQEKSPGY